MKLSELGTIVLVGAGKMGMAMAQGWLVGGLPAKDLVLVDPKPSESTLDFAGAHGLLLLSEIPSEAAGVLVLAVKPQVMDSIFADAQAAIGPNSLVMSIAAGISIKKLAEGLGTDRVVRTMPNTPAQVGKGVTGVVADTGVLEADRAAVEALLAAAGKVLWFEDEGQLDAVTAVSGSGPAYVFLLVEALAAAGVSQGLRADEAEVLARQTVVGAAALLDAEPTAAAQLRKNVTSPGGTTAAALDVLMASDGLTDIISKAVAAAHKRSVELGE